MKYGILEADNADGMAEKVSENSERGWILRGGISVSNGIFYQAITHPSDGAAKPQGDLSSLEGCGICGHTSCTNSLHKDLEDMATMMVELRKVK